jgi:hypothetical protein
MTQQAMKPMRFAANSLGLLLICARDEVDADYRRLAPLPPKAASVRLEQ